MAEEKTGNPQKFRILIPEQIDEEGTRILQDAPDVEADIKVGIKRDELLSILGDYDAIITRSATQMNKEAIDAGGRLKVIARAGVGVDNVDLQEASRRGIVVINAPTGNTIATAEQTMALMLSIVRKTPQAFNSIKAGKWDRKSFSGHQLNGKKILVIGLGRVGSQVASHCRGFGMDVMGYDPHVSEKKMQEIGIRKVTDLAGSLSLVDVVTLHVPITRETRGVLNEQMLRAMKPGSYLINCARGGLVDEAACAQALKEGRLAGAAFDVYSQEPPASDNPLFDREIEDRIVLTPHIAASTTEAQTEVARIAVRNALAALRGEQYEHAVNLPFMEQHLNEKQKNFLRLARKIGILAARLSEKGGGPIGKCSITLRGNVLCDEDGPCNKLRPYTVAAIKGMLEVTHGPDVNYMIAPMLAQERGIAIEEGTGESRTYKNVIEIEVEAQNATIKIVGTITEEGRQHVVRMNDYWIDFVPHGQLLIFQNHDRPGVIGRIGKLLGDVEVNIANFSLGRKDASGLALAVMEVDGNLSDELISQIEQGSDMIWATSVKFNGEHAK